MINLVDLKSRLSRQFPPPRAFEPLLGACGSIMPMSSVTGFALGVSGGRTCSNIRKCVQRGLMASICHPSAIFDTAECFLCCLLELESIVFFLARSDGSRIFLQGTKLVDESLHIRHHNGQTR